VTASIPSAHLRIDKTRSIASRKIDLALAFRKVFGSQIASYAACYHMAKIGRPAFILPKKGEMIFLPP